MTTQVYVVGSNHSRSHQDYALYKLDLQTGEVTEPLRLGQGVYDIAFWGNELYWIIEPNRYQLLRADLEKYREDEKEAQIVGSMKRPIKGLTFNSDGQLYGIGEGRLFRINSKTAEATPLGSLGVGGSIDDCDLAINNKGEAYTALYGRRTDILAKVDLGTGKAERIADINFNNVVGLGFIDGVLYGVTSGDEVITIDTSNGQGTQVADINPKKGNRWREKDYGWSGMAVRLES